MLPMTDVQKLVRRHAPGVRADDLRVMPHHGWGGDSDAYLVDGAWIFRFPRSSEVARRLEVEVATLPVLAPRLPLRIPEFTYVVRAEHGLPVGVGYRVIPGEPLRRSHLAALGHSGVDRIAGQLGSFLGALHQIPTDEASHHGVPAPSASPRTLVEAQLAQIRATIFPILDPVERRWVSDRFDAVLANPRAFDYAPTLCHGDLSVDHIIVDAAVGRLTGVIDFGDLTIGDPAGEFTWRADYGEAFFRSVLSHYAAPQGGAFAERVQFRIDCLPLAEMAYGLATGNAHDVEEGRAALRRRVTGTKSG
jgi:aminoglycoside 2''-phosphotransferase